MKIANLILATVLLAMIAANMAIDRDPGMPAHDYFPEMVYSQATESYAAEPAFADAAALQLPPEGTIARGASLVRYEPTPADAIRAGQELTAPAEDAQAIGRGRLVFQTFCVPCHGAGAAGDGAVVARGYPPPPSLLLPHARDMRDGQMFHVLTYGQVNMPSYAGQIDAADRWRVIAYVRQLQGGRP